jgi:hypothetical protein
VKHGRIISIRSRELQGIRNNIRKLLIKICHSEFDKNQEKADEIYRMSEGNLSSRDSEKIKELYKKQEDWGLSLKQSACTCGMCGTSNEDAVWHAGWGEWWCLKCFRREEEAIDPKERFNKGVIVNEEAEKPCHILNWCPYGTLVESFRIRNMDSKYTCLVFGHDCPVFYVSQQFTEFSQESPIKNEKLKDNLKNCRGFNDKKIIVTRIEKPCHILDWCPYGSLESTIFIRELDYKYGCKIFPHDCPAFYHAEALKDHIK